MEEQQFTHTNGVNGGNGVYLMGNDSLQKSMNNNNNLSRTNGKRKNYQILLKVPNQPQISNLMMRTNNQDNMLQDPNVNRFSSSVPVNTRNNFGQSEMFYQKNLDEIKQIELNEFKNFDRKNQHCYLWNRMIDFLQTLFDYEVKQNNEFLRTGELSEQWKENFKTMTKLCSSQGSKHEVSSSLWKDLLTKCKPNQKKFPKLKKAESESNLTSRRFLSSSENSIRSQYKNIPRSISPQLYQQNDPIQQIPIHQIPIQQIPIQQIPIQQIPQNHLFQNDSNRQNRNIGKNNFLRNSVESFHPKHQDDQNYQYYSRKPENSDVSKRFHNPPPPPLFKECSTPPSYIAQNYQQNMNNNNLNENNSFDSNEIGNNSSIIEKKEENAILMNNPPLELSNTLEVNNLFNDSLFENYDFNSFSFNDTNESPAYDSLNESSSNIMEKNTPLQITNLTPITENLMLNELSESPKKRLFKNFQLKEKEKPKSNIFSIENEDKLIDESNQDMVLGTPQEITTNNQFPNEPGFIESTEINESVKEALRNPNILQLFS